MGGKFEYYDGSQWVTAGPNVKGKKKAVKIVPELNGTEPTGSVIAEIDENAILPGTEAVRIPVGTTLQRPTSPQVGDIRFNTDKIVLTMTTTGFSVMPNALDAAVNPSTADKYNTALGTYTLTHTANATEFFLSPPSGPTQSITVASVSAVSELDFSTQFGIVLKWSASQNLSTLTTATVKIEQSILPSAV